VPVTVVSGEQEKRHQLPADGAALQDFGSV
jgi:hypothetical protein